MKEILECAVSSWNAYWGESSYLWLLGISLACLLFFAWKKKEAGVLVSYQILILAVFFTPVTAGIIQKCIGALVYWRMLWLFPTVPLIAFAMVLVIRSSQKKVFRFVLTVLAAAVIVCAGTSVWQAGNYEIVNNRQQVPDDIVAISRLIAKNRTSEESRVAADNYVASYIRVYDPSIQMPYGREGRGAVSKDARALWKYINSGEPVYKKIAVRAKRENCEFLVFPVLQEEIKESMDEYGYEMIGSSGYYGIFRRKE